jgi:preprotein translocase subunit SecE
VNRETKRMLQRQGQLGPDGEPIAGAREGRAAPASARAAAAGGGAGAGRGATVAAGGSRPSFPERVGEFLREVRNELVKVAWPGRSEVINYTIVVFFTIVLLTSIVFGLDVGFAKAVIFLFKK